MTDPASFRAQFPVFQHTAYLNSGTEGPVPQAAADALQERVAADLEHGRSGRAYFDELMGLASRARKGYARVLNTDTANVALTGSTTEGLNTVLGGLRFDPGDEILASDQEHPGMLAPLRRARLVHGVSVRFAPFDRLAEAVGPRTKLIACSHVSWVGGEIVDVAALRATGVPILLDAAQGLGAIPLDMQELGVDFYAGSGQKWMCGPEGSGALYVRPDRLDDIEPPWPSYVTLAPGYSDLMSAPPKEDARRFDTSFPPTNRSAWAVASMTVLEHAGWEWVHERAATLAARLADTLRDRGCEVAPRGRSTLVAWSSEDPEADVARLAEQGVVIRQIPSAGLLRAAVGAWNSDDDLDHLVSLVT